MGPIPFRRIKLFKGQEIAPRRPALDGNDHEPRPALVRRIVRSPILYALIFTGLIGFVIAYLPPRTIVSLRQGEVAPIDVVAPSDLTIQDQETTDKRRREAEAAVLPVYVYDPNVFVSTEDKVRQTFAMGRQALAESAAQVKPEDLQPRILERLQADIAPREISALLRARFPQDLEESLIGLVGKTLSQGVVLSKSLFIQGEAERGFTLLRLGDGERPVRASELLDVREAKEFLAAEIGKLEIPVRSRAILQALAGVVLAPNVAFNKAETTARRARAVAAVEPVFFTLKKSRVLIRKGDEASAETVRLVGLMNESLRGKKSWWSDFAGTVLMVGLLFAALWGWLRFNLRRGTALRELVLMGVVFVLSLAVFRLSGFLADALSERGPAVLLQRREAYAYAFPYQMGTLLVAFLSTGPIALVYAVMSSLLVGYLFGANFYLMLFSFIGGLAAIYGVKLDPRQRRTSVLRSGLMLVAPANVAVVIILHLVRERPAGLSISAIDTAMGLTGALLGGALAFVLLPLFEALFGFLTPTKIVELTNSDLPILRQLALEAPGTYHHSLIVSTLSEKAAEEIQADPRLAKAGGLYHDIGKLKRPEYFIENKAREDLHRELSPSMSTLVITSHVKEGLDMARKLRLPAVLRQIIEQHHGTSVVRYFYQKAKERYDPEVQKVGEEDYRYPGPPPQTKEAAIVMLADSVEAACRTLRNPSLDNLKRVITDIFNNYLQDGQMDDCNFSLRELREVAASFLSILNAIYHPRVDYPGFDFEKDKDRRPSGGSRKPAPANGASPRPAIAPGGPGAPDPHDRRH